MSGPSPRRILMTADAVGGVWTYAVGLAAGLAERGVETVLAVLGPQPGTEQRAAAASVPGLVLQSLPLPLDWLASSPGEITHAGEAIADLAAHGMGIDLVQLNTPALAAAARFRVPVVAVSHSCLATWWRAVRGGPMPDDFRWRSSLATRGLAAADALVAPTAAFARATAVAHGLSRNPATVHNGLHPAAVRTANAAAPFAFTAGRLWDIGKDAATLDRAAARGRFPVIAAGPIEGPDGSRVALPHLELLGSLPARDVSEWLARRPVFVSMARYEPFGLAVLEAAQTGCALVLSDTPGFRELWDGAATFVAPGGDEALARAIARLLENAKHRAALGSAALARSRRYGVAAMTSGMLAVYAAALSRTLAMRRREMQA